MVLDVINLSKTYIDAGKERTIFENVNIKMSEGESALLLGNSGCGKSTLLQIVGLIQDAKSGSIYIDGEDCSLNKIDKQKKNKILKHKIGFIYQFHYLFNDFTAMENLVIPQLASNIDKKQAEQNAIEMLDKLKILHRKDALPSELSGGERQRIAIARAIIKKPKLILADEPTGNLDNDMSNFVVDEMLRLVKEQKIALLMVSHNRLFSEKFDKTYELKQNGLLNI